MLAALSIAFVGCTVDGPYTTDAETGSTHALLQVQRDETVSDPSSARADALAGFVQIPAAVDARSALELVGLGLEIPAAGQCAARVAEATDPQTPAAAVEFLEAGDVTIDAADSSVTLAPRPLATVADLLSGVLYTTRNRAAAPLPAAAHYVVHTTGATNVSAILVSEDAPPSADGVSVNGVPFAQVRTVSTGQPIAVKWTPGSATDLMVIELTMSDGNGIDCTVRDDLGNKTIPAQLLTTNGSGSVTLRRIRRHEFEDFGLSHGELRFDFGLTAGVSFTE